MRYRHVIKRFTLDREENESEESFAKRAELSVRMEASLLGSDRHLDVDSYVMYIYEKNASSGFREAMIAVGEIFEVPKIREVSLGRILLYSDDIFLMDDNGRVTSLDTDEAVCIYNDYIRKLEEDILKVKKIEEQRVKSEEF